MLRELEILDYAIIDRLAISLGPGMTVLTGETGAGKSILVDALGLVLGDRAASGMVKDGADRAEISASFDLQDLQSVDEWLAENDLPGDGECVIRRVVGADGRSRGYINGRPATMGQLRELGERLVDIHGQHEHQSLLRRDEQRRLLDHHGAHLPLIDEVSGLHQAWAETDRAWHALTTAAADRAARLDLLRYQVRELEALALEDGQIEALEVERLRLAHAGKLFEAAQVACAACDPEHGHGARASLQAATNALQGVTGIDPELDNILAMLDGAAIQVGEATDDLRRWVDRFEMDPERRTQVEDRLGSAHQLARKHRIEPAGLPGHLVHLRHELDELDHADARLASLAAERDALATRYREAAGRLTASRTSAAVSLAGRVTEIVQTLGMPGGRFEVVVEADTTRFAAIGQDSVEFRVSANPGQSPRPLAKVASGGELSRISLAVQVTSADATTLPCLVFDEVDAGIGGGVAEIVGRQLKRVAEGRQVLCVTHLAQVASRADTHLRVVKETDGASTRTHTERLDTPQRVDELARMLGGVKVTDKARATAREMLG